MGDLSKVSIGIKTFLRDAMLCNAIAAIEDTMPEAQMIIADDGEYTDKKLTMYDNMFRNKGHIIKYLLFDSGFGAKSNRIAEAFLDSEREYLLIASDDFDFRPPEVRQGIEKLVEVLDSDPGIHIASGRVNNRLYEFDLLDEGSTVTEVPVQISGNEGYVQCDLTVNYSLVRREVFEKVRWDEGPDSPRIGGGEHAGFFLDCKRAGFTTVWVNHVNINEQTSVEVDPRYNAYRARARSRERSCFKKRGIKEYILGNGQIDYLEKGA
jgi:hypothetical protein